MLIELQKTCIHCAVQKPVSEFYKHPQMADGYLGRCKVCHRSEMNRLRGDNPEVYRQRDRERGKTDTRKEAFIRKNRQKRLSMGPEYDAAHNAVSRAVKAWFLVKPTSCQRCNSIREIEAHHDDHAKKLEVMWLCPVCHAARHKELGRLRTVSVN
jgi:hypothetical protein